MSSPCETCAGGFCCDIKNPASKNPQPQEFSLNFSQLTPEEKLGLTDDQKALESLPDGPIFSYPVGDKLISGNKTGTTIKGWIIDKPEGWKPAEQLPDEAFRAKPPPLPDQAKQRVQQTKISQSPSVPSTPVMPEKTQTDSQRNREKTLHIQTQPLPTPEATPPAILRQETPRQTQPAFDSPDSKPKIEQPREAPTGKLPQVKNVSYIPPVDQRDSRHPSGQPAQTPQIHNADRIDTKPQTTQRPLKPFSFEREKRSSDDLRVQKNNVIVLKFSSQGEKQSANSRATDIHPSTSSDEKSPDMYNPIQIAPIRTDEDAGIAQMRPANNRHIASYHVYDYAPVANSPDTKEPSLLEYPNQTSENSTLRVKNAQERKHLIEQESLSLKRTNPIETQEDSLITILEELHIPKQETPPVLAQEMPNSSHADWHIERKIQDNKQQEHDPRQILRAMIQTHKAARESLFTFVSDIKNNAGIEKPAHQSVQIPIQENNIQIVKQFLTGADAKLQKTTGTIRFDRDSPQNEIVELYQIETSRTTLLIQLIENKDTICLITQQEALKLIADRLQTYLEKKTNTHGNQQTVAPEETLPDPALITSQLADIPHIVLFLYFCLLMTLFPQSPKNPTPQYIALYQNNWSG